MFLVFLTGFISLVQNCRDNDGPIKILCSVLIVLISVLAIPAGISYECYAGVKARAKLAKRNNLHKVGSELLKYARNNNDKLPSSENWCDVLTQYNPEITRRLLRLPNQKASAVLLLIKTLVVVISTTSIQM